MAEKHYAETRYIYRSSITGRIVSEQFARENPSTTTREAVHETIEGGELWETRAGAMARVLHRFREDSNRDEHRLLVVLQHPGSLRKERLTFHGLDGRCAPGAGVDDGDDLVRRLTPE